ncbi:MAG: alanine dehydrogenase [Chloroflexota bacterium]|nr:alanine dehydrogenase [Chloroflexota bacterium]
MLVGVPKEIKDNENRVALTPAGVGELVHHGHPTLVERGAGIGSGFADAEYEAAGAELIDSHEEVFARAAMIIKVKEPVAAEYGLLRPGQLLFTYLHLAADEPLTRALVERGVTAIAYETVQVDRTLPLLTPMSEVAGRMAVQVGAHYLEKTHGGRGQLLGGVPGVRPSNVVIIGGGVVGTNAAQMALGAGAMVTILEKSADRMRYLSEVLHGNLVTVMSHRQNVAAAVAYADLLIGAVLIPGAKAPKLASEAMIRSMRPGAVVVDVAIDQGGCIETAHPTSHSDPVYDVGGVIHYCVTNMPGAVPRTSTYALSNVTLPYALTLADQGFVEAVRQDPALAAGVNVHAGEITYGAVADAFGLRHTPLQELLYQGAA